MFRTPCPKGIVGATLQILRVPHLSERGVMPHLSRQTMKVLGSEGVRVEEFLYDISKSKRKYSYTLP